MYNDSEYFLAKSKGQTLKTWKNKLFQKRNHECTNIVFARSVASPGSNWIETTEAIPATMTAIEIRGDVQLIGWL